VSQATTLDKTILASVADQLMSRASITVNGKEWPVRRTSSNRLRTASFDLAGRTYQAIEQNPDKPSRWGKLARDGHQVVQFKDVETNRFVAVAVDGKARVYGHKES